MNEEALTIEMKKLHVSVQLLRDSCIRKGPQINNPEDIFNLVRYLSNKDRECFVSVHLDARNHVIGIEEVAIGSLNASIVHPREVFKSAILNNAASIILAHNHPSGDHKPSEDDIEITKRLENAGKIIGIKIADHVVIGNSNFLSFRREGLLQNNGQEK
jgi:DNA repair protein RadC